MVYTVSNYINGACGTNTFCALSAIIAKLDRLVNTIVGALGLDTQQSYN